MTGYAELQCTSDYSFLRGASSAEELFIQAGLYGLKALAITDRNSLAGIVRAHQAAKATGVRLIVGCRLVLLDNTNILVYPTNRAGYGRLCRMLSLGKARAGKCECYLTWEDVEAYHEGLIAILVPDEADEKCRRDLSTLCAIFGPKNAFLSLSLRRRPGDTIRLHELFTMATAEGVKTVATNDVLFHVAERRMLQDVVTCIREGCTIDTLGFRRERSADRHLLPGQEMARRFQQYPASVSRTLAIADRCKFSLDELSYQYPKEICIPGMTPQEALEQMTWKAAQERYPEGVPLKVQRTLHHELNLIRTLEYAPYFLTVNSIVRFARSQEILCQGRGSAANSAVCFVLGITSIDPDRNDLLFERFISEERREPPDIDVDFEHERREIVIQWVYDTYGRDRAALCSTVARYRARGALRDVGKALGLPEDMITDLGKQVWAWSEEGVEFEHAANLNLNVEDPRLKMVLEIAKELLGFPRHLSQHPGGFVLTDDRLDEMVPIEPAAMDDRQVIEWDKDDIDALKFMKMDCLALGMLSCMKRAFNMIEEYKDTTLDLATIPSEDPATYAMIRKADTLGVFQIESRAQMTMLPRLKPKTFYDLVVQVAIVRPGPIQGNMVHPYLRRREGLEPVEYPKPELEKVLGKTLGVPLFQEQAMRVAIDCAGFTAGEADQLRRSMATFKFTGGVSHFRDKLVNGMVERGYTQAFAENTFSQLEGFGSYGFPESHAASFAILAYASSWLKCHHPDVFCAALLNAQPMGFYAPAQIVRDARDHGIEVRPVCVNASHWDCTLEKTGKEAVFAVRLGMRMVQGLSNAHAAQIMAVRADEPFADVQELWQRAQVPVTALVCLAEADAFNPSMELERREALWAIKALRDEALPLFQSADVREGKVHPEMIEPTVSLKPMTAGREVVEDYTHTGLTLRQHPLAFLRPKLEEKRIVTCAQANGVRNGGYADVAGLVLVRQKPGSAKGVMFITIEDETGISNLVVWPKMFDRFRQTVLTAGMIAVKTKVQREGEVVHLVVYWMGNLSNDLSAIADIDADFRSPLARGDEMRTGGGSPDMRGKTKPRQARDIYIPDLHLDTIKVKARNFR